MIIKQEPMSLPEVREMAKENQELEKFIKAFVKTKAADAKKLKEDLEKLGILKIKPGDIAKIINLMPEDASDLNKIFVETSLNEDETNKTLEVVKKYR